MSGSNAAFSEMLDAWHHGEIPSSLMANAEFTDYAARRLAELLEGPLSDENAIARVEAMAASFRSELEYECPRWKYPITGWEKFYREMLEFCDGRAERMINSFCSEAGFKQDKKEEYFGHLLK